MSHAKTAVLLATSTLLFWLPAGGWSAIIVAGDLIQDTDTNLEWLSWASTEGRSVVEVQASTLIQDEGWEYASFAQLCTLTSDRATCESGFAGTLKDSAIGAALSGGTSMTGLPLVGHAYTAETTSGGEVEIARVDVDFSTLILADASGPIAPDVQGLGLGSALVRSIPIPEPGSPLLFGVGSLLVGAVISERRRY